MHQRIVATVVVVVAVGVVVEPYLESLDNKFKQYSHVATTKILNHRNTYKGQILTVDQRLLDYPGPMEMRKENLAS